MIDHYTVKVLSKYVFKNTRTRKPLAESNFAVA